MQHPGTQHRVLARPSAHRARASGRSTSASTTCPPNPDRDAPRGAAEPPPGRPRRRHHAGASEPRQQRRAGEGYLSAEFGLAHGTPGWQRASPPSSCRCSPPRSSPTRPPPSQRDHRRRSRTRPARTPGAGSRTCRAPSTTRSTTAGNMDGEAPSRALLRRLDRRDDPRRAALARAAGVAKTPPRIRLLRPSLCLRRRPASRRPSD